MARRGHWLDAPFGAPPPSFSGRPAIVAFVNKTSGAGTPRECFVMASTTSKRSPAGNADGALVGRDVISIDEPRRGNCHEISAIC
jgi:hypothetical protein